MYHLFYSILKLISVYRFFYSFISTLVTAVLTHHLGWVATVLKPKPDDTEAIKKLQKTGNPLWGQLNDLYGAIGFPTKMAHTIITGSNKPELITKMLNFLTYFIRCNDVLKQTSSRWDVVEENSAVDEICREKQCIPKENYKKYQDHLDEMAACNLTLKKFNVSNGLNIDLKLDKSKINHIMRYNELQKLDEVNDEDVGNVKQSKGLSKTSTCLRELSKLENDESNLKNTSTNLSRTSSSTPLTKTSTCFGDLSKMIENENEETNEDSISNDTVCIMENSSSSTPRDHFGLTNEDIHRKVQKLFRGLNDVPRYHSNQEIHRFNKVDLEKQRSSSSSVLSADQAKNVVFILGDNEPLVGLKKNTQQNFTDSKKAEILHEVSNNETNSIDNIPAKILHTESLDSSIDESGEFSNTSFKDSDFVKYSRSYAIKPSTSWTHLEQENKNEIYNTNREPTCSTSSDQGNKKKTFLRSQSEPPENVKGNNDNLLKPRFRYTGVKFNFQQHPQIFTNYMRSKNIELSNLSFAEKAMKFNGALSTNFDFTSCEDNFEEVEALQTPSNASELEFTSELGDLEKVDIQHAKESENLHKTFRRNFLPNTIISEPTLEEASNDCEKDTKKHSEMCSAASERNLNRIKSLKLIELPMPK